MGTQEKPRVYKTRLLPDKNGDFYQKYLYHFFQTDEKTYYILCNKTHGLDEFCPWCYVNQQLWKGNKSDQEKAYRYKRNERYVGNTFIIDDPRDVDKEEDKKVSGTRRLYEFPATVESKVKNELTNEEEGFGPAIFDPENGHDFLIKVLAKKPDKNNKIWPDYSLTEFSRKPGPILNDPDEIEKVMESVYDLSEYIKSMEVDWETHEKILKQELVWEEVEDIFYKKIGKSPEKSEKSEPKKEPEDNTKTDDKSNDDSDKSNDDLDDDQLLEELSKM